MGSHHGRDEHPALPDRIPTDPAGAARHHDHDDRPGRWPARAWSWLRHLVVPHRHDPAAVVDDALVASRQGLRALWISFAALMVTAVAQAVLVVFTGSVALFADTLHNLTDALTAIPLAIAFLLGRTAATRRFTHGLGRAEDLAGLVILAAIAASAGLAAWEAVRRLAEPREIEHLGWVAVAGVVGFAGNELVARYRIVVGRRIGSAALVADGLHARTDGLTSLAVLLAAGGAALGWDRADPLVGLGIAAAILLVFVGAAREVLGRILDGVDPDLVDRAERALRGTPGVRAVDRLRLRWVGHRLHVQGELSVDPACSLAAAHHVTHDAEHRLRHDLPGTGEVVLHLHPDGHDEPHERLAHHHRR